MADYIDKELNEAVTLLKENNFTCVLYSGKAVYTSSERGIKPLINWLSDNISKQGFYAVDKVVGKASAFLYVLLGVKEVYACVLSRSALKILEKYRIRVQYEKLTDYIINRAGTNMCPMEKTVLEIDNPDEALIKLKEKLKTINSK